MKAGTGATSSGLDDDADEFAFIGNEFAAAKEYEVLQRIGGGTFGEVVKARHRASGRIVALKRVWENSGNGFSGRDATGLAGPPAAVLREVEALQMVRHRNVVSLHRTFLLRASLAMEMECCTTDLSVLLRAAKAQGASLPELAVRSLLWQLLSAIAACHAAGVLHRDVKPGNLLLRGDGSLALGDFGQARPHAGAPHASAPTAPEAAAETNGKAAAAAPAFGAQALANGASATAVADGSSGNHATAAALPTVEGALDGEGDGTLTPAVGTRWYRAPELLLGCRWYGDAVDVWAAGCVFAELLGGKPLMPGESDIDQLGLVGQLFGGLTPQQWPGIIAAPDYGKLRFRPVPPVPLQQQLPGAPPAALALLQRMLRLDPGQRPSAAEALQDPYFTEAVAEAETASSMLQQQVQLAVAYADAKQRRREGQLAAFEAELNML